MKTLITAGLVFALFAPAASAQQREEPRAGGTFDDLLAVAGLTHLSQEDKDKVERLLLGLNQAATTDSREKAGAFESVVGFLDELGFSPELVMSSVRDGQPILIVGRIIREFTADIPMTLNPSSWRNGVYFVRWTDDGAAEIIVDGEIHDFRRSLWRLF